MTHRLDDERGAVLVIVAFLMTTILGFAALAVDLGYARQRKAQAQNSADFAALAGAGVLKTGTNAQAETAARDYVQRNGFSGEGAEVNVPPASGSKAGVPGCIQVKPSESFPTIFGRIFNVGSLTLHAQAVACASPGLGGDYAVFAGSTSCADAVSFSGANRTINGGIHSNNDMKVVSSGTTVNGAITYLAGDAPEGNITVNPSTDNPRRLESPLAYPEVFHAEDYAPGGKKAELAGLRYHNAGAAEINELWLTLHLKLNPLTRTIAPGLYYTTGDIHLNGNGYNAAGATFVSGNGNVHLNGNNFTFGPWDPDGLVVASFKNESSCSSGQAVVKLNGNNHSWTGVMFAPQGPLDFAGTNLVASLNGRLVAQTVKLSGSSQTITKNSSFAGTEGGFELVE
ncbi:MAG TPA: pilus assembly protein TadG-related protein [Actinomycetota bacterium]|nr:pilus assembly protein TadG-related protein [Actinomycetota bacterium]